MPENIFFSDCAVLEVEDIVTHLKTPLPRLCFPKKNTAKKGDILRHPVFVLEPSSEPEMTVFNRKMLSQNGSYGKQSDFWGFSAIF